YDPDKVNKKAAALNEQAYDEANDRHYAAAIEHLTQAIAIEPKFVDAFLSRSNVYASMKNYDESVKDFQLARQLDPVYCKTFLLPYSISLAGAGQFQEALDAVNEFL